MNWTLEELLQRVEEALHVEPAQSSDSRVSAIPNARTIRYYASQGLVDTPESQGSQARYTRRHLMQTLAIKRYQSKGWGLREIKEALEGASNRKLASCAKLPNEHELVAARKELDQLREKFWTREAAPASAKPGVIRGLELEPDTFLTFKIRHDLLPEDVEAIRAAAMPLIETLHERKLLP